IVRRQVDEHADALNTSRLLRTCRERPRGRAAEQREELASMLIELHSVPCQPIAGYRIGRDQSADMQAISQPAKCRLSQERGSESAKALRCRSALPLKGDLNASSRHVAQVPRGDPSRCSKRHRYSITLSARCRRRNGTSTPKQRFVAAGGLV